MGEATRASEPQMAAYWLWARDADAQEERETPGQRQEREHARGEPRDRTPSRTVQTQVRERLLPRDALRQ